MSVIYVRTNKVNGKQYVGQATDLKVRQYDWNNLNQPYAGPLINNARKKYGLDAFGFEILKECSDDELNYWETYFIEKLNTKAPNGYNLTEGGGGCKGYHQSEETKRKRAEKLKGRKLSEEHKKKIGKANKGKKMSEEWKEKQREAQKGRKITEETRKKISETTKGRRKPPRSEEHKKKISESKKGIPNFKLSKPVLQIDKNTNEVIAEFPSIHEVERQLGFLFKNISSCCNNKRYRHTAYGYKWQYAS